MDPNTVKDITPAIIPALAFLVIGGYVAKLTLKNLREDSEAINKALEIKRAIAGKGAGKENLG